MGELVAEGPATPSVGGGTVGACKRCSASRRDVAYSHRLRQRVCWRCYHASFTSEQIAEFDRGDRQRGIAQTIRGSLGRIDEPRQQAVRDCALLVETSGSVDEVLELVDELADLGLHLEVRR